MERSIPSRLLVTGGAGFIGCHASAHFKDRGAEVLVVDNLSRRGAVANAEWLARDKLVSIERADVRDAAAMARIFAAFQPDMVLHAAGQVAVTTSVLDPRKDFEDNLLGTFNVLEAARALDRKPFLLFTSTNKVYGGMEHVGVELRDGRWSYRDLAGGADEKEPLDFHSPYGCSKGGADQYVHDYFRIYGLPTVVFRQSCIYGTRQFGVEDQGWVAWFTIRHVQRRPVTIYGDGRQVRDALFVDDLVAAYHRAWLRREHVAGEVFNIGGGPGATMSLLELLGVLENLDGNPLAHSFADWRPGDQKVFIANVAKAQGALEWRPTTMPREGVAKLYAWVKANIRLVESQLAS